MIRGEGACLVCGKPLHYFETEQEMTCVSCGKKYMSNAACEDGHYICDACHSNRGVTSIMDFCRESKSTNPIAIAQEIMEGAYIHMHGNEHHVLVGAALLTAFHNSGGEVDFEAALSEMEKRGSKCPGGTCGFWGCCGAAVSSGMFLSIVNGTTPLSGKSWGMANQLTAKALENIGKMGGPRCCKRNSFTAMVTAADFLKENYGIALTIPQEIECTFFAENKQCKKADCPYYPK